MVRYPAGNPQLPALSLEYARQALSANRLSQGEWVARFETEFAALIGVDHAVATNNGTSALHLALLALGIGEGDAVIVPATTFVATANAVTYTGATPVIVDVNFNTWTLSIGQIEQALATYPNIAAIIAVHLYGVPCDMAALRKICNEHGLLLIEDAAEALGATYQGQMIGSLSDAACFSFYANKTLFTGEGGMLTTQRAETAARARLLRGQGQSGHAYYHTEVGYNYRMTDMQAAIGLGQLPELQKTLAYRSVVYKTYVEMDLQTQALPDGATHGYWAYPTLMDRGYYDVAGICLEMGLELRPVFYPLNKLPPYHDTPSLPTPVADLLHRYGVVLPLYPSLYVDDAIAISRILKEAVDVKTYYENHP